MQTTSIYIELVIIGAEVCTWVFTIFALIDDRVVSLLKNGLSSIPMAIILLGLCYVVGVVFDRIADWIFKKYEVKIRDSIKIPEHIVTSHLFLLKDKEYLDSHVSRKRIIRGTAINVLPISIALAVYLLVHHLSIAIAIAVLVCGFVFCTLCLVAHYQILKSFFKRAKRYIESEKEEDSAPADDAE